MSAQDKPAVIIVHGAWHRPIHYVSIVSQLQSRGYTVRIPALSTAGWDSDVPSRGIADDVVLIKDIMNEFFKSGKQVIVLCHSFGGLASTDSVVGESIQERQGRGQPGGVKALIYLASFASPNAGLGLYDFVGLTDPSKQPDWWSPKNGLAILEPKSPTLLYTFVNDELTKLSMNAVVPQSLKSFQDKCKHGTPEVLAPKHYLLATNDGAIPPEAQRGMAQAAGAEIVELPGGHSPFMNSDETETLLGVVERVALG